MDSLVCHYVLNHLLLSKLMSLPHKAGLCYGSNVQVIFTFHEEGITYWFKMWPCRPALIICHEGEAVQIIVTQVPLVQSPNALNPPTIRKLSIRRAYTLSLKILQQTSSPKELKANEKATNLVTGWRRQVSDCPKKFVPQRSCLSWTGSPITQPSSATSAGWPSRMLSKMSPPSPACKPNPLLFLSGPGWFQSPREIRAPPSPKVSLASHSFTFLYQEKAHHEHNMSNLYNVLDSQKIWLDHS